MFHSARIRLTVWYLLIIAFISISFSGIIYRDVVRELENGFIIAEYRVRGLPVPITRQKARLFLQEEFETARHVVLVRLVIFNGLILAIAGAGGYFLAGKTLEPIEKMVEGQKRFVADASHELRTPLTSMMTETEVALRDKKLKTKDLKNLLLSNLEEINRMKNFTNYLLSLSLYEANNSKLPMEKVSLKTASEEALKINEVLAKEKNIKFDYDLEDIKITGNEASLIELISILINNAIKYSPHNKKVKVVVKKIKRSAVVRVEDQGIGIDENDIPYIFDRFYRADASRNKTKTDGFGLGLSIAKSIVDAHGGEIKVESKIGEGSTFIVKLQS